MKIFNIKYLLIFAIAITLFGSCGKADIVSPEVEKTTKAALNSFGLTPIIINANSYSSPTLPLTITGFTIEEEIIMMPIFHPGTSISEDFILVTDGNLVVDNNGVYSLDVRLIRIMGTSSKKISNKELKFSLSPIKTQLLNNNYSSINSIQINILGVGQATYIL